MKKPKIHKNKVFGQWIGYALCGKWRGGFTDQWRRVTCRRCLSKRKPKRRKK